MWLLQVSTEAAREGFWPVTVVGWITVFGFITLAASQAVQWGKLLQKINGFGSRVTKVEENCAKHGEAIVRIDRQIDKHGTAITFLAEDVGETKASSEALRTQLIASSNEIKNLIVSSKEELQRNISAVSERVAKLER